MPDSDQFDRSDGSDRGRAQGELNAGRAPVGLAPRKSGQPSRVDRFGASLKGGAARSVGQRGTQLELLSAVRAGTGACTSCGLCNSHCPTFVVTADERDGPRGRIALMQTLMETADAAALGVVQTHLDRCIGCGTCDVVCPEDVAFETARSAAVQLIQERASKAAHRQRRDVGTRLTDATAAGGPGRTLSRFVHPLRTLAKMPVLSSRQSADIAGARTTIAESPGTDQKPGAAWTEADVRRGRVLLVPGCQQRVRRPNIGDATIRLLARSGFDVVVPPNMTCCGAIENQLGLANAANATRQTATAAWTRAADRLAEDVDGAAFDAVVTTGVVCAMGVVAAVDPALRPDIRRLMAGASDVVTFLAGREFGAPTRWSALRIGVLGHCREGTTPSAAIATLLTDAGFTPVDLGRPTTCCGGFGAYPAVAGDLAAGLRDHKLKAMREPAVDILAVDDVGCYTALAQMAQAPIVHVVELLDWAYGGVRPTGLDAFAAFMTDVPVPAPLPESDFPIKEDGGVTSSVR